MFKPRINTKFLRHIGIVLIALPEPITTPFGVAFVIISHYLARRREAILNRHLHETLKYYLSHFKRFRNGESSVPAGVRHYTQLITQYQGSCSLEANPRRWLNTGSIVHHSIDMESLYRRYGMKDGPKAGPGGSRWEVTSGKTKNLTSHSLAIRSVPQHHESNAVRPVKVTYHSINMASLRRRYGLAASPAGPQQPPRR